MAAVLRKRLAGFCFAAVPQETLTHGVLTFLLTLSLALGEITGQPGFFVSF